MAKQEQLWMTYAVRIQTVLQLLFEKDSEDYVGDNFFQEGDATQFFHALGNVVPTTVFQRLTGINKNCLEFNHLANQLCFQYSERPEEDTEVRTVRS